eukprot:9009334-Karenia_brevis.AAC.1
MSVMAEDLVAPLDCGGKYVINLFPKDRGVTSKVGLTDEALVLDCPNAPWLGPALQMLRAESLTGALIDLPYNIVKKNWDLANAAVGLKHLGYVTYQLRHGGPSHD